MLTNIDTRNIFSSNNQIKEIKFKDIVVWIQNASHLIPYKFIAQNTRMDFKINGARIGDTETTVIMNSNTFDIEAYTIDRRRNIDLQIIINDVLVWRSPLTGKEMGSKYCYATTVSLDTSNLNLMDINTVRIIAS